MPVRDTPWPAGTPCWIDIAVPDVPAAAAFYGAVLGWTIDDKGEEFGHYGIAQIGGNATAGVGPIMQEGDPTVWTQYFATDDIAATTKLVTENGGTVLVEPMEVPGNGHMSIALDPAGAVFGLWQATGMIGAAHVNDAGGLVWEDGRSADPDAARAFYSAVFGFTYQPVEGAPGDYNTFHAGGDPLGGLGGLMGSPASHWLPYFGVADADAAVAAVRDGGGSVVDGPDDTPFGRMATVQDPFGATFAIIGTAG